MNHNPTPREVTVTDRGRNLLIREAMKMQTLIAAEKAGKIAWIHVHAGTQVETGNLLLTSQ